MNKNDLIKSVAIHTAESQVVTAAVINSVLDRIADALCRGEEVRIHGFGTFSITERAERTGRNPRTGAPVNIAASKAVKFKATKGLV